MHERTGFALVAGFLVAALVLAPPPIECQAGPSTPDSVFRRLVVERIGFFARADSSKYRAFIAPDAIFIGDDGVRSTRAQQMVEVAGHKGQTTLTTDSLHVTRAGDVALVYYREVEHNQMGSRTLTFPFGSLDTFIWREGRWLLLAHTEAHKTNPAAPVVVDSTTLQQYVGRYEWWPGYEDFITRRGSTLYDRTSDEKEATLNRAATPESFYRPGDPSLLVFVRDVHGRVASSILHWPDGTVTVGRRMP